MKPCSPPRGVFQGRNFMTPDVLGYYKLRHGIGYAELSEGRGMSNQPIFGVTVRPKGEKDRELSKMCTSRREAEAYIEELS